MKWTLKAKLCLWIPLTSVVVIGGGTVGILATMGYFHNNEKTNINSIFGSTYEWSNNATNSSSTSQENSSNVGSQTIPWTITEGHPLPTKDAVKANLRSFLDRSSQTSKSDVVNDLVISQWNKGSQTTNITQYSTTISAISDSTTYIGNFTINIYAVGNQVLSDVIINHIVDHSISTNTINAVETLSTLATQNINLNPENVQIGYKVADDFFAFNDTQNMNQAFLGNTSNGRKLWKQYNIDGQTGYGYSLAIHAIPGGLYSGSTDVTVYLLLHRIAYDDNLFFTNKNLFNHDDERFDVMPSLEQAKASWIRKYNSFTSPFSYANFYTSDPNNITFEFSSANLLLTFGNANEFYTNGTSTFVLNVKNSTPLSSVFMSDDTFTTITTDTVTNPLIFISKPTSLAYERVYADTITKLLTRYPTNSGWNNFRGADFTSMQIQNITETAGGQGYIGTIVIQPIDGSLIYSGSVTITWQTYDYQGS
ncbi:MAG: hypothetical protein LBD63_02720 [Mycoplasmataceae bacterium]|nr:hypothetical protein [Mycoplasmataceae bacterium]